MHILGEMYMVVDDLEKKKKPESYPLVNSQMHLEWKTQVCLLKELHK